MANNLANNPWTLDTASTSTILHSGPTFIVGLQWSGYNSAGDQCIVQGGLTAADVLVWTGRADLGPIDLPAGDGFKIRDFILKKLDSGILTVYLK